MAVSKRTRFEVFKRDNHTCRYCHATDTPLTVDHVTPVSLGGSDEPSNLVAACRDCNAGKASSNPDATLIDDVAQDSLRWSAAMKLASDRLKEKRGPINEYGQAFTKEWDEYLIGSRIYDPVLPDGWTETIDGFFKAGLPLSELTRALAISMAKGQVGKHDKFRYMCGICWSVLREMQAEAQRILTQDDA